MPNSIFRTRHAALALAFSVASVSAHAVSMNVGRAIQDFEALSAKQASKSRPVISELMQNAPLPTPLQSGSHPLAATGADLLSMLATSGLDASTPQTPSAQAPATPAQTPAPANSDRWWPAAVASPPFPLPYLISEGTSPIGTDQDAGDGWLQKSLIGTHWDKERIRVYGWFDFGYTQSSSNHNDFPNTYDVMPNRPVLDQAILRFERTPDTVQTKHDDWGFRMTSLYGIDYRFTAGDGYFFDQLQQHNQLYGYDPVEMYYQYYFHNIGGKGALLQVGRYISPCDIEAQLSPDNYTYSHTLMYSVDPYTYTGAEFTVEWNKTWSTLIGIDAGNDKSLWEKSASLNFEGLVGWHSPTNRDVLWGGVDQIGNGHFSYGHDSEQITDLVWTHIFDQKWHMLSEVYYMWEYDSPMGGTEIDGPSMPFASGGGPGTVVPGQSHANGYCTYLEEKLDKTSYVTYRTDWLGDPQGWRTGYPNNYFSLTFGYTKWLTPTTTFRPEIRYEWADKNDAYDNGARKTQWTLAGDFILHF